MLRSKMESVDESFPSLKFPNLTHLTFNKIHQPLMQDVCDWLLLASNQALSPEMHHHHHQSGS